MEGIVEYRPRKQVSLIDARQSYDFREDEGGRWVTLCEQHGQFCQHETRKLATAFLAVPEEWCEECAENAALV